MDQALFQALSVPYLIQFSQPLSEMGTLTNCFCRSIRGRYLTSPKRGRGRQAPEQFPTLPSSFSGSWPSQIPPRKPDYFVREAPNRIKALARFM